MSLLPLQAKVTFVYLESPGGVRRVGLFGEETRGLGPLVEQMLGRQALSLRDVPDLEKKKRKRGRGTSDYNMKNTGQQQQLQLFPTDPDQ